MSVVVFHEDQGFLIPSEGGRPLCGLDFNGEAKQWVQNQDISAPIAIVIGLGAGHHVRAWLEANPDSHLIVIDSRSALNRPFAAANPDLDGRYDILNIATLDGLLKHEILAFVAESLPPVLCFRPAFGSQSEVFDAFFATLTGRNGQGLRYFLESFGFDADAVLDVSDDGRLFTIKDLGVVIDTAHEGHPKASAIRVLRELIV